LFDTCIQVNLQRSFGGGEVYTAAFSQALQRAGITTELFADPDALAWQSLPMPGVRMARISNPAELIGRLRGGPRRWLAFHSFADAPIVEALRAQGHFVSAFAHMPLYGRDPRPLRPFDLVLAVSRHVIASLRAAGIDRVHPEPMYGVAHLERGSAEPWVIRTRSRYDWDRRKFRDRLLGVLEPLWRSVLPVEDFKKRPGLTLGIVSRITPIKQFPALFSLLAPLLVCHSGVQLEIFGSGGYASVRDLDRSLAPIRDRTRYWGHQQDVAAVYRQIDFLLAGLPEKEALGLNVIEAQACGTPVLAPDAPPFDETVVHGVTGLRYRDPREDGGAGFERCLQLVLDGGFRFDSTAAATHLAQFSEDALVGRVGRLVDVLRGGAPVQGATERA
jgi:glycosyltransferase involved in cell wall biosynthesis